jgi:hypothetical protein
MTRHQMIFTTHDAMKQSSYVRNIPVVTPAPRSIPRGVSSNPGSFLRGLVFPSKAGCGSCGR